MSEIDPLSPNDERFRLLVDSVQDYAIFMLDSEGRVLSWNAGAQRLKQYTAAEIIGRSFETFYPPEAIAAAWPQQELRLAESRGRFEDEGWRLRKDGTRFWANVVLTALRAPDGSLSGYAKVTRDLTERRQHDELLRRSEEQFRLLLESVTDYAIFMLDPEGRVLTWNTGAQAIKGYAASEAMGRHFSLFFTAQDLADGVPEAELRTAREAGRAQSEGWRVRKDGEKFWANVVITPILDGEGALRGYAKVTRDLTEQRRMADLERSTRHLQEFIAMLAHELRNPLAPIRNAVSILHMHGETLLPAVTRAGEIVGRQLGHLTRLVDDLLDIGRIATGKIALRVLPIDFRDVVAMSVEATRPAIELRGHQLSLDLPAGPLPMHGDATRLAQALQNLLQNAARYTPEGGQIALSVQGDVKSLAVTVRDNGIGIAPEARVRIFDLFTQERTGRGGLGIGLSLARTLVEQHRGSLSVSSEGLGRGSCFALRLPVSALAAPRDARPPQPAAAAQPESLRVLVVDDNRDSADTMVELLCVLGHEARGVYGARAAEAAAAEFAPRLILLDLNMPDGDGFSVIQRIRAQAAADPGDPPACIVAMTGYGQPRDRERTRVAGFDAHLTKPVSLDDVQRVLDGLTRAPVRD